MKFKAAEYVVVV